MRIEVLCLGLGLECERVRIDLHVGLSGNERVVPLSLGLRDLHTGKKRMSRKKTCLRGGS